MKRLKQKAADYASFVRLINTSDRYCKDFNVRYVSKEKQAMRNAMAQVDEELDVLKSICGEEAYTIVRQNYVDKKTLEEIAAINGVSKRTILRKMAGWEKTYAEQKS